MDFFGRLRQLSSAVERDVADIQRSFDLPQSEGDSTDGAALLLLQEVKNDVKQVRVSCTNTCSFLSILEKISICCALIMFKYDGRCHDYSRYLLTIIISIMIFKPTIYKMLSK